MTSAFTMTDRKYLSNWQTITQNITPELSKATLGSIFIQPLLKELGFDSINFVEKDFSFSGVDRSRSISVKPDYTCWKVEKSIDKNSAPLLVVEVESVRPKNIELAIEDVRKAMLASSAIFGLATDGLELQLWQRYDNICVPRTPREKINDRNIQDIISLLQTNLKKPRSALTTMFWNAKGGVGKTTITGNIGAALSKHNNHKVLLISLDPQSNLNSMFGLPNGEIDRPKFGIADALRLSEESNVCFRHLVKKHKTEIVASQGVFAQKKAVYVDIISADISLEEVKSTNFSLEFSLERFLNKEYYYKYDYILIDAPSAWQGATRLAAIASDIMIPIIDSSTFAIDAIIRTKNNYFSATQFAKPLPATPPEILGYIINSRFQIKSTLESSVEKIQQRLVELDMVKDYWIVPNSADIEKAHELGQPVVYSNANSEAAKKFMEITSDIFL
jgi:cellulose biosynthesis protein BcsQ